MAENQRVVLKWQLAMMAGPQKIGSGTFLHVAMQGGLPCVWTEETSYDPPRERIVKLVGTGHEEIDPTDRFLGTAESSTSAFVWHVYEVEG